LLKRRRLRRAAGGALLVAGALLLWLAPDARAGLTLLVGGIVLEVVGITLERRDDGRSGENGNAVER
jgi:drug/metabolite transporter (DMT)-like permease